MLVLGKDLALAAGAKGEGENREQGHRKRNRLWADLHFRGCGGQLVDLFVNLKVHICA